MRLQAKNPFSLTLAAASLAALSCLSHSAVADTGQLWQTTAGILGFSPQALYQLALKRTGVKWADGRVRPWPWTVTLKHGCGSQRAGVVRLSSKTDTERFIVRYGRCDMDIGLMQVNRRLFRTRFNTDPVGLADPQTNLMAAAILLKNKPVQPGRTRRSMPDPSPSDVTALVANTARAYHVDPEFVMAVIRQESGFNSRARSRKNAMGLMQLIPATARRFGVKNAFDPADNVRGGVAYLNFLLRRFGGNVALVLAGYNAGENAVERFGGVPPYEETQAYVAAIMASYRKSFHPVPPEGA